MSVLNICVCVQVYIYIYVCVCVRACVPNVLLYIRFCHVFVGMNDLATFIVFRMIMTRMRHYYITVEVAVLSDLRKWPSTLSGHSKGR